MWWMFAYFLTGFLFIISLGNGFKLSIIEYVWAWLWLFFLWPVVIVYAMWRFYKDIKR